MSNNKRKTATAVVATAVTAAVLLTGTYAWQSISQTATNIASDTVNPGGRLHDDFSGPGKNKDIYVENFADEQIFARIQLSEYFEIGQEAGANFGVDSRNVSIITTDEEGNASNPEDKSTWSIHKFDDTDNTADYWTWATGGSTIFMPTFNKNKDSLEADINGTYESIDGEGNRYSDYVEYEDGETVTENAIYDADTNDTDEIAEKNAQIDINYKEVSEEHIATATATAELKSMQEWIDEGKPVGDYWVYDTDGWVYYAKPIEAGEATGLLLDGIELTGVVDDNWYYAINVEAQFVTANDLGTAEDGTGFYDLTKGTAPTQEALDLLEDIGVNVSEEENREPLGEIFISIGVKAESFYLNNGYLTNSTSQETDVALNSSSLQLDALVFEDGEPVTNPVITWSATDPHNLASISADGLLQTGGDGSITEPYYITVTAEYNGATSTIEILVAESGIATSITEANSTEDFYINESYTFVGTTTSNGSDFPMIMTYYVKEVTDEGNVDTANATIDDQGIFTATEPGTYIVGTYPVEMNRETSCVEITITVYEKIELILPDDFVAVTAYDENSDSDEVVVTLGDNWTNSQVAYQLDCGNGAIIRGGYTPGADDENTVKVYHESSNVCAGSGIVTLNVTSLDGTAKGSIDIQFNCH